MPEPATIRDVEAAGFTVALASGSVEREQDALAQAQALAAPDAVRSDVEKVASEVATLAAAQGLAGQEFVDIVSGATAQALQQIQGAHDERVEFHRRALAIAEEMPDVWHVSALGDPSTPDDDVSLYVSCTPDGSGWDAGAQEMLDALVKVVTE
jgi:ATP/maltotriose-dependent transcriptional regulator MalT